MARNRNKVYQQGDRINIYLSRDLTPEFIEWLNKQSDLSNFFLYAAQQLYQQTGFVDVSEVMPRKINFDLSSAQPSFVQPPTPKPAPEPISEPVDKSTPVSESTPEHKSEPEREPDPRLESKEDTAEEKQDADSQEKKAWGNLEDYDDPYA